MTVPVILAGLWIIAASIIAFLPRRFHKPGALYLLIPTALVLLPWLYASNGPLVGTLFLTGFGSILRWPVYFLGKFVSRKTRGLLGR